MSIFLYVLLSVLMGFIVAYLTGLILSVKKAKDYPGGSMAEGVFIGLIAGYGFGLILVCGIAGIIGWILYCLTFKD